MDDSQIYGHGGIKHAGLVGGFSAVGFSSVGGLGSLVGFSGFSVSVGTGVSVFTIGIAVGVHVAVGGMIVGVFLAKSGTCLSGFTVGTLV